VLPAGEGCPVLPQGVVLLHHPDGPDRPAGRIADHLPPVLDRDVPPVLAADTVDEVEGRGSVESLPVLAGRLRQVVGMDLLDPPGMLWGDLVRQVAGQLSKAVEVQHATVFEADVEDEAPHGRGRETQPLLDRLGVVGLRRRSWFVVPGAHGDLQNEDDCDKSEG